MASIYTRSAVADELEAPPLLERVVEDRARGFRGFLVIDSLSSGTATGGIRMREGLTLDEIRDAARAMTWKLRFAGIPNGGAKAGIDAPEDLPRGEKRERLMWFADAIADHLDSGRFVPAADLGTDGSLIAELLESRGFEPARHRGRLSRWDSAYYTALTVVTAAEAALVAHDGAGLGGRTVAIEGLGSVGRSAASIAAAAGATVVTISTSRGGRRRAEGFDVRALVDADDPLEADPGAEPVGLDGVLIADVDVLLACGPGATIDEDVATRIAARVIAPGANRAFDLGAAEALRRRGRLAVPCFVANCGGATAGALASGGVPAVAIHTFVRRPYRRRVERLLREAVDCGVSPLELALRELPPLVGRVHEPATAPGPAGALGLARRVLRSSAAPALVSGAPTYLYFWARTQASNRRVLSHRFAARAATK